MGTLPVAYGHAGDFLGFPLVSGDTAVQSFYAVSGFCMAVVLNEKYRPGSSTYSLFTSNRFLRLFPGLCDGCLSPSALYWWVDRPIDS